MHYLIFDTNSRRCIGAITGGQYGGEGLTVPVDTLPNDLQDLVLTADGTVQQDPATALVAAKTMRIAQIKQEAAAHLQVSAWQVERAREREQAGWVQLADVAAVLAGREAVRRSSSAAEEAVLAMTRIEQVQAHTWAPTDVPVPAPRLLTHEQFIQRFDPAEWQAMTEAARESPAMDAWMRRFALATVLNLDDVATQAGVQALEMVGVLATGRAQEVLA